MKNLIILLALSLLTFTGIAQDVNWKTDKAHTEIQFIADYMVFTEVTGEFSDFNIMFATNGDDFNTAKISFTAKAASISTNEAQRDGHLKSPDFFDVAKYPEITFVGKSMKSMGENKFQLVGDLTMKDVTKEVTMEVTYKGIAKDPYGNMKAGFRIKGAVNRYDWGLKWNATLEAGGLLVSEVIEIICNVTLIKG